jgi:hypothetical protein
VEGAERLRRLLVARENFLADTKVDMLAAPIGRRSESVRKSAYEEAMFTMKGGAHGHRP